MADFSFAQLQGLIAEEFGVPATSITRETTAVDVVGWDSISHAGLLIQIENRFGITFPDEVMFDLNDVGALYDSVAGLLDEQQRVAGSISDGQSQTGGLPDKRS